MIRKLILALGATVAIGAAALVPTAASAHIHGHGHWFGYGYGYGYGVGLFAPAYVAPSSCYVVKRAFVRADGRVRVRRVAVCD